MSPNSTDSNDHRYRQLEEMFELAVALQGTRTGLSYADIADRWECSEKTAQRRMRALRHVFGDALVVERHDASPVLRFRLRHPVLGVRVRFTDAELEALAWAQAEARRRKRDDVAGALDSAAEKANALSAGDPE